MFIKWLQKTKKRKKETFEIIIVDEYMKNIILKIYEKRFEIIEDTRIEHIRILHSPRI